MEMKLAFDFEKFAATCNRQELVEMKQVIEHILGKSDIWPLNDQEILHIEQGNMLEAIKAIRYRTNCTLLDAKEAAEKYKWSVCGNVTRP